VWREISVPDAYSLDQVHRCIQLSFAWLDYHLYEFRVDERRFSRPDQQAEAENAATTCLADLGLDRGRTMV
jgi:hypothetical protein